VVISVVSRAFLSFRKYKNISHFLWRRRSKALSFRTFQQGNNGFYGHECCLFSSWNLMVSFMAIYCTHNIKDEFKRHNVFYWLSFLIYRCYYKISIFLKTIFSVSWEVFVHYGEDFSSASFSIYALGIILKSFGKVERNLNFNLLIIESIACKARTLQFKKTNSMI
jgi:hypothetical protein